jgi:Sulfotransferase domain
MTNKLALKERLHRAATFPLRLLPDFLVIGTARGGTTSLYRYLELLPGVGPAARKEIHFFDLHYRKGTAVYRCYFPTRLEKLSALRAGVPTFVTGEACPYYIFHPNVPKRVKLVVPRVKLIALLRNPVERAYSHYHLEVRAGIEKLSFEEAIDREEERLHGEMQRMLADENHISFNHQHYSYRSRGLYADQVQRWLSYFPRDQLLILRSEDLFAEPAETMRRVTAFLDLPTPPPDQTYRTFNTGRYASIEPVVRRRLVDYFEPHNRRLYDFLGVNYGWEEGP